MPSLKQAALWCPLKISAPCVSPFYDTYVGEGLLDSEFYALNSKSTLYKLAWGIAYTAPGEENFVHDEDPLQGRGLFWRVGKQWRPSTELRKFFQQIGRERYGDGLYESFEQRFYGEGLVPREVFRRRFEADDLVR